MIPFNRPLAILALSALALLSSGCMLTPNNGDLVGNRDSLVPFQVTTIGDSGTVTIQARNQTSGAWQDIDHIDTHFGPIHWEGYGWYFGAKSIRIPRSCWKLKFAGHTVDRVYYSADVRAITSDGLRVQTFQGGFFEWFSDGASWRAGYQNSRTIGQANEWNAGTQMTISTYVQNL